MGRGPSSVDGRQRPSLVMAATKTSNSTRPAENRHHTEHRDRALLYARSQSTRLARGITAPYSNIPRSVRSIGMPSTTD
jgi:hypothetical protein